MFVGGMGTWCVESKSDPRWNNSGTAFGAVAAGGPPEMYEWIEKCKKEFGDPPPDCMKSFWKE